jgi:hypothetical protein
MATSRYTLMPDEFPPRPRTLPGLKIVEGFEHFAEYRGEAVTAVLQRRTE